MLKRLWASSQLLWVRLGVSINYVKASVGFLSVVVGAIGCEYKLC